jgi:hypothetical protein
MADNQTIRNHHYHTEMKKYLKIIPVIFFSAGILFSCNKDNASARKDYNASIKGKTWSGEITYTGLVTEYYSVHFKADNTLEWSQLSGDYTGHWTIKGKELTMTFDLSPAQIKADISDDDKLMNITDNTGVFEIISGGMVANPATSLENTVWKGTRTNTLTSNTQAFQLSFMSGGTVEIKLANFVLGAYSYSRSTTGAAIRIKGGYYGVLMPTGEMKGSDSNPAYPWQTTKQ